MSARTGLDDLHQEAARVTARGSKSFRFATRFFPPELARAAHAVYWFCRYTDDLADEEPDERIALQNIEHWDEALRRTLAGSPPDHPVLQLFARTVADYGIPHEYPLDLVQGMRMDLTRHSYATFGELRVYCYRVASVVGLMMTHVIGFREPAPAYAVDLGIAMQLTNILRDVGEDLQRNRIYLPLEDLERFGCNPDGLRSHRRDDAFRRLMDFEIRRARDFYRAAEPGLDLLDPGGRFSVEIAARVYRQILAVIEEADYQVFTERAVVPPWRKHWLAMSAMVWPAVRHSTGRLAFWRAS